MANDYKVKIDGIEIMEKSLFRHHVTEKDNFNYQITTQALTDSKKNLVVTFVLINITKASEANELLGKLIVAVGFEVMEFEKNFQKNDKGIYEIPVDFENFLKSIAISTTRGVMFSEFRGTSIHRAVLPIILMDTLKPIKEDFTDFEKIMNQQIAEKAD